VYLFYLAWQAVKPGGPFSFAGSRFASRTASPALYDGRRDESIEPKLAMIFSVTPAAIHQLFRTAVFSGNRSHSVRR